VAVFEFLEPIPPGLKRGQFMQQLQESIECASTALLTGPRP
jgi:1-acyl-sn-glycerol-3-phosphate acyltransferase